MDTRFRCRSRKRRWAAGKSYGLHGVTIEAECDRVICGVIGVTKTAFDKGGERAHEVLTPDGWANASLIATAPDLYEYVKVHADRGDIDARKLIAKADGEKP